MRDTLTQPQRDFLTRCQAWGLVPFDQAGTTRSTINALLRRKYIRSQRYGWRITAAGNRATFQAYVNEVPPCR